MILKSLQKLGLDYKEQQIYFALLQLEKATANQIANKASIKRPTTYDILARLQKEGFIAETYENGKRIFIATPPEKLTDMLDNKKRELEKDLPYLLSIFNTKAAKPKVAYFEGYEGIKQLYEDTLSSLNEGEEILAYITNDTIDYMEDYAKDYVDRRVTKGIKIRAIHNYSDKLKPYFDKNPEQLRQIKIADKSMFLLKNEINIYGNKMIIITYSPEPFGILIESNEVIATQRAIFEMAWDGLASL